MHLETCPVSIEKDVIIYLMILIYIKSISLLCFYSLIYEKLHKSRCASKNKDASKHNLFHGVISKALSF